MNNDINKEMTEVFDYMKKNSEPLHETFYVYILTCKDLMGRKSFYTGMSKRLIERIQEHKNGSGAKYTRNKIVWLSYVEEKETFAEANDRERQIKRLSHEKKNELIKSKPLNFLELLDLKVDQGFQA